MYREIPFAFGTFCQKKNVWALCATQSSEPEPWSFGFEFITHFIILLCFRVNNFKKLWLLYFPKCFHYIFIQIWTSSPHTILWGFGVLHNHMYERGHKEEHSHGALNSSLCLRYLIVFYKYFIPFKQQCCISRGKHGAQTTHHKLW